MFSPFLDLWSKAFARNECIEILTKMWKFQNAPNWIIDLYDISFIFTIIGAIALKGCTYPQDCDSKATYYQSTTVL